MRDEMLIGNAQIKKILVGGVRFHAYLIEGGRGSGRHTLARLLTQAALCRAQEAKRPCGVCPDCKKLAADAHPDLIRFSGDIKAEPLRALLDDADLYPSEGGKKVYVLDDADALSVRCQNILLKTLEEPPEYAVFILICRSRQNLLETVRSRCVVLPMAPVDEKQAYAFLQKKYGDLPQPRLRRAVRLSGGLIGVAEERLRDEKTDREQQVERFFEAFLNRDPVAASALLIHEKRDEFNAFLAELCAYAKRVAGYAAAGVPDGASDAERRLAAQGLKRLCALCAVLDRYAQGGVYNVNIRLWSVAAAKELVNL